MTTLAAALADALEGGNWRTKARAEQLPPPGDWVGWIINAGRGFGKTRAGAEWIHEIVASGTAGRIGLIAPTAGDARDVMVEGPSGILETAPKWNRPIYEPSKRRVTWSNGAIATTYSAEESERLRGPNHDACWLDEVGAWNNAQEAFDMMSFGLRLGKHPRWLITTTPRNIKLLKTLLARDDVVVTRGSTFDNEKNLAPSAMKTLRERYEGSRLGRQELYAEMLSDTVGALWSMEWLDRDRVKEAPKELKRVIVAIDPATTNNEGSDETGIVGVGIDGAKHCYVLADYSGRFAPHEWAKKAVQMYHDLDADLVVGETNNGGDMISEMLRHVAPRVPFKKVVASRGKVVRAEPVAALYEQSRVHHVGSFTTLEDQMTSFSIDFDRASAGHSPDRVDALVWAISEIAGLTNTTKQTDLYALLGGRPVWR